MKTIVVSGMLGSGKTTFIGRLLQASRERTVVLVNDFGALGIDGEVFSAAGIAAVELPSGCICCTLASDMISTIQSIRASFDPERLVIEPSGVAAPSSVLEALESAGVGPVSVIGIVAATEFLELHEAEVFGTFFRDQIVNAHVILVNKADLAGVAHTRRTVEVIESLNPAAIVLSTVQAELAGALPEARTVKGIVPAGHVHFRFDSVSFRIPAGTSRETLERLMSDLAAGCCGKVVRAKALVATDCGPWRFDLAFGNCSSGPFDQPIADSRMVVIGESLDGAAIRRRRKPSANNRPRGVPQP